MIGRIYRKIKTTIYKMLFPRFRSSILFEVPKIYFLNRLKIGDRVRINDNIFINAVGGVNIGNDVILSHGVTVISTGLDTKNWVNRNRGSDCHINKAITIGDNVWVGANVTICSGVTVARNSIIAAGAVVTNDLIREGCLYGGVPAKVLKEL